MIENKFSSRPKTANTRVINALNLKDMRTKTISSLISPKSDIFLNKKSIMLSPLAMNLTILPDSGGGNQNNLPMRTGGRDSMLEPTKSSIAYKKKTIYKITKKKVIDNSIYKSTLSIMKIHPNIVAIGANPNKVIYASISS